MCRVLRTDAGARRGTVHTTQLLGVLQQGDRDMQLIASAAVWRVSAVCEQLQQSRSQILSVPPNHSSSGCTGSFNYVTRTEK